MKPKHFATLVAPLIAISLGSLPSMAGNSWDGGGGDTNIDTGANWNPDGTPAFDLTQDVTFGTAGSSANFNVNGRFKSITMNRTAAFTMANGGGNLILRSSNSGSTYNLTVTSTAGGTQTIDCPLQIDTSNADANKLFTFRNNRANSSQPLDINGDVSLASGSTVVFNTRFECVAGSVTRFDGAVSGLNNLQQSGGVWAGDLIFGGNKNMPTSNVNIAATGSGVGAPATTARLFLGEAPADTQTWGNITLNNRMKLVVGGTITAGTISAGGSALAADTRIVGNSATNSSLSVTGGTINDKVTVGGVGTNENNLNLVKTGSGTLTIASGTHTYTGTTTVNLGTLAVSSAAAPLASSIILNSAATLSGEGSTTGSLTFNAGASTLNFDPATPGSFTAGSVTTTGATIIANPSTATTVGQTYTVLTTNSGTFGPSDVAAFLGGGRSTIGGAGTNTITYTADAPASLTWKGNDGTNPSFWDVATTFNWSNGSADRFFSNDAVNFDDTASSYSVAIQGASISPGDMVFNHSSNNYTVTGGIIGGAGSLTKSGSGTLTLGQTTGTNSFSGALNINGGVLSVSSLNRIGGASSARAIQLGGGTLEYTYAATNAETSDIVPLTLNPGNSGIRITGNYVTNSVNAPTAAVTLRLGAPITGSGNLEKSGSGILAIGKNIATLLGNTFSGTVSVTAGVLEVRNPDSLGLTSAGTSIDNASFEIFSFSQNAGVTFNPEPLTFSGTCFLRTKNEDADSDIQHVLTGPVTVSANASVGIGAPKQASISGAIPNTVTAISPNISSLEFTGTVNTGAGSTLKFGLLPSVVLPAVQTTVPQTVTITAALTGGAAVEAQGEATSLYTLADPEYSGNTTVNGGILSLGADNSSNNASTVSIAASGATLDLNFAGTDTVGALYIGGVQKAAGVWGSATSGAPNVDASLTGTGTLTVTSGPAGFATWASANAPGQTVSQDHDNDGVENGVEYFMGLSGSGFTANPGVVGNTVTWPKGASYTGSYPNQFVVQTSSDLISWTTAPAGTGAGQVNIVGNNVTYTLPSAAGTTFVRLKVNED